MARKKRQSTKKRHFICDRCRREFYGIPIQVRDKYGNTLNLCKDCAGVKTYDKKN